MCFTIFFTTIGGDADSMSCDICRTSDSGRMDTCRAAVNVSSGTVDTARTNLSSSMYPVKHQEPPLIHKGFNDHFLFQ